MQIHINKLDFMVILLWIAIFPFYLPFTEIYYIYQIIIASAIMILTVFEWNKIPGKLFIFIYPSVVVISCFANHSTILFTQVIRGITSALLMVDIFALFHKYIRRNGTEGLLNILYKMSKFYFVMNVIWIATLMIVGRLNNAIQNETLFSRGKFPTAYMLIFYLMFFYTTWSGNRIFSKKRKRMIFIILSLICIILSVLIQISTGIVAVTLFLLIMLMPSKIRQFINKPMVLVGLIIASMVTVFSLGVILSSSIVQDLITNVLHEDLNLTGRMQLYELLYPLMLQSGLLGGGFGSYVASGLAYHGWYNAQNGLAEIILTYGFVGAGAFLILVFTSSLYSENNMEPLNAAILVFIIVAIIEIPFNLSFVFLLALLMLCKSKSAENSSEFPQ